MNGTVSIFWCSRPTPCVLQTACVLQSLSAQLRSRELSLADAEAQLAAKDEALAAAGQETANMHKVRLTESHLQQVPHLRHRASCLCAWQLAGQCMCGFIKCITVQLPR